MIEQYIHSLGLDLNSHDENNRHKATRLVKRLKLCEPFGEDYEAITRHCQTLLKKNGERQYQDPTIKDIIRDYSKYVSWKKSKGENKMSLENEITTQEQEAIQEVEVIEPVKEKTHEIESDTEAMQEFPTRKGSGRPISTNRTDKITLYMKGSTMRALTALADYDRVSLTELINKVLENYLPTRSEDIEFLQELEKMKEAHRKKRGINKE